MSLLRRVGIALIAIAGCRGSAAVEPMTGEALRTATVHRGDIVERVVLTGEVHAEASDSFVVPRTDQNGPLAIRWMAEEGTSIKAGDKVLEFDNSSFTKALEEKRLAVLESEMVLKAAQDVTAMETATKVTELRQHQIAFDKATVKASVPPDLMSGREAQDRALDKRRMEVAVKKAEEALAAQKQEATLDLEVKRIDLDKAHRAIESAEKTIGDLVLTAPRDGVVVVETHPWEGRKFHNGDTVQAGMTIITMPDLARPMEVHAELSDVDDGRISIGMAGSCTLDAYPTEPLPCTVKDLAPVARTKGENSLRRAFAVVVSLAKTDPARMRPGMSVKVELRRPPIASVLVVPLGAIVIDKVADIKASEKLAEAKPPRSADARPTDKVDGKTASASKSADNPPSKSADNAPGKSAGNPPGKSAGNAPSKSPGQSADTAPSKAADNATSKPADTTASKTADNTPSKAADNAPSKPTGPSKAADIAPSKPTEPSKSADNPQGKSVDRSAHVQLQSGELREVTLGACDAQACAIDSGLVDGDVVVVGGGA